MDNSVLLCLQAYATKQLGRVAEGHACLVEVVTVHLALVIHNENLRSKGHRGVQEVDGVATAIAQGQDSFQGPDRAARYQPLCQRVRGDEESVGVKMAPGHEGIVSVPSCRADVDPKALRQQGMPAQWM